MMMIKIGLPAGGVVSNGVRRDKSLSNQDQPATVACSEHSEDSVPVFFWSRPLSVAFLTEKWNSPLAWPSGKKGFCHRHQSSNLHLPSSRPCGRDLLPKGKARG